MCRRLLVVFVSVVTLFGCRTAAVPSTHTEYKRGCQVTTSRATGSAFYEPIVVVGEKDGVDEDGKPVQEWWVYYPNRPREDYLDVNGNLRAVNVPKYKILIGVGARLINGIMCKCPW